MVNAGRSLDRAAAPGLSKLFGGGARATFYATDEAVTREVDRHRPLAAADAEDEGGEAEEQGLRLCHASSSITWESFLHIKRSVAMFHEVSL